MSGETFTVGELAEAVTGGNVRAMSKLLNDAGADPRLSELEDEPGAAVSRQTVIDLWALRGGRIAAKLSPFLRRGLRP